MEILSGMRLFSSAFLGTTASLVGFLLLLFWGFMIVAGVKVERPLYRMLCVVLCAVGFSMLFGLLDAGSRGRDFAGGVLGHWVGVRCAGSGTAGFSLALLWIAVPAALLLATDWLFLRFLFGGRGLLPVMGSLQENLLKGFETLSSPRRRRRPSPSRRAEAVPAAAPPAWKPVVRPKGWSAPPRGVAPPGPTAAPKGGTAVAEPGGMGDEEGVGPSLLPEEAYPSPAGSAMTGKEEKTAAFDEDSERAAKTVEEETSSGEPEGSSGGAWWKAEAVMEEELLAAGGGGAPARTVPVPDLDRSWWVPPAAPPTGSGPEAVEEAAPEYEEEPEPEVVDEVAGEAGPGVSTEEAPEAPEEPGPEESLVEDRSMAAEERAGSIAEEEGEVVGEEETGPGAEDSSPVMEPEPQAEFSFARDLDPEPPAMRDEEVELFREAVMVVVREKKGSISLLQRELGLGYFKAAKLLNILESRGVVAPYAGSIARKVIIGEEQAERIIAGEEP